ncbi:MAG: type II toxin-antitoxin system VapC family toxin [Planctomycetes bacterium]|nr:type II toxin-antitoxin system VapC family toxin [Planctomycetota bacterium]
MIFWDTSALVRAYVEREPDHERAHNFLTRTRTHLASVLLLPEVAGAVTRRAGSDRRMREALLERIRTDLRNFNLVPVDIGQIDLAVRLVRHHALKGIDAVHIASAMVLARESARKIRFVTGDGPQAKAARAEGLRVIEFA